MYSLSYIRSLINILISFLWKKIFSFADIRERKRLVSMVIYYSRYSLKIRHCTLSFTHSHSLSLSVCLSVCVALNRSDVLDTDINSIRDIIVDSLFSVFVTAGNVLMHTLDTYLTLARFFITGTIQTVKCPLYRGYLYKKLLFEKIIVFFIQKDGCSVYTRTCICSLTPYTCLQLYILIHSLGLCSILIHYTWYMYLFPYPYTTGAIPIIRCSKGNAAEMVAEALDKKIRDNLRDPRNSMFTGDNLGVSHLRYGD